MKFKAEVRRAEKTFPLTSYEIACRVGDLLLDRFPGLKVDVHSPDWVLSIEIREHAYLYGPSTTGPYGLPGGSSGRGLLLLSGGIDSPVAGWMMAKRGMALDAVYFHSAPFTSEKAREKVEELTRKLACVDAGHRPARRALHAGPRAHQGEIEGRGNHAPPAGLHDEIRHPDGGKDRGDVPGDRGKPRPGGQPDRGEHGVHRVRTRSSRCSARWWE